MPGSPTPSNPPSLRRIGPGVAGLLSVLVYLSLPLVPPLGIFLALLAPLPLLQIAGTGRPAFIAWGWVAAAGAGAVLLSYSVDLTIALTGYLLVAAWPASSVEIRLRRGWGDGRWIAVVALVALVASGAALFAGVAPRPLAEVMESEFNTALAAMPELAASLRTALDTNPIAFLVLRASFYLPPAFIALYVATVALFVRPRLALLGLGSGTAPFSEYRSEEWLPVGFILGGLGWVFLPEPGKWLAANLLVTVAGLYFVQGLAIIHFYLGPRLRHNRWVRAGVLLLALHIAVVIALAGLVDGFVRLRRSREPDEGSA